MDDDCLMLIAGLLIVSVLAGCASSFVGMCGIMPLGTSDGGILVAKVACQAE